MHPLHAFAGLLRSLAIYYGHPLRHRRLKALYEPFIRRGDLAVDTGAHVGNHTRALRALGARVLAVEPQPHFAGFLDLAFGRDPGVTVIRGALGAEPGRGQMRISSRHPTVSTLDKDWQAERAQDPAFRGTRWDREESVEVTTLDALIDVHGPPGLLKIDAEGAEPAILAGLSRPIRTVIFEILPAARDAAVLCVDRLVELGWGRFNWTIGEQAVLQSHWVGEDDVRDMIDGLFERSRASEPVRERNVFAIHDGV